jgi:hypothetical protein
MCSRKDELETQVEEIKAFFAAPFEHQTVNEWHPLLSRSKIAEVFGNGSR